MILMTRRHWVRQALRFLSAGRGRTVQSLHFELRAKFRVYFEFRNTEISHAILIRPIIEFFVVSGPFGCFGSKQSKNPSL